MSRIDDIEARANAATEKAPYFSAHTHRQDVADLVAFVREVEEMHQPVPDSSSALYPTPLCRCAHSWPCDTAKALDRLNGGAS